MNAINVKAWEVKRGDELLFPTRERTRCVHGVLYKNNRKCKGRPFYEYVTFLFTDNTRITVPGNFDIEVLPT